MADPELPSFDLVVATVGRDRELGLLLESLERQTHRGFRVLIVDQNEDDRVEHLLRQHGSLLIEHLRSNRGLSLARNAALERINAQLVAFPDDDCVLPDDLLERVAKRFAGNPFLDGLTGRAVDTRGRSSTSWSRAWAVLTRDNLWNRAISFAIFLRAPLVAKLGGFDEQLGLGAAGPWASGEEIDYLVRAVSAGARIEYDPDLVVLHEDKELSPDVLRSIGARDGASIGYILRKHGYPARTVLAMLIRPAGGVLVSVARRDAARARFHLATLRGRLRGFRTAR